MTRGPVSTNTRDGGSLTIRPTREDDLDGLLEFINGLVDEEAPILADRRMTREEEAAFIRKEIADISAGKKVGLVAELEGKVVGHVDVTRGFGREDHVGTLGISVTNGFRNQGIGSALMTAALEEAQNMGLRMVKLGVFDTNDGAIRLYERFGFQRAGLVAGALRYKGG